MRIFRRTPPAPPVATTVIVKRPPRISIHARNYIANLLAAPAGTVERMVGDTVDLLGDECLFATVRQIKAIYAEGSPQYKIAAELSRLAVKK